MKFAAYTILFLVSLVSFGQKIEKGKSITPEDLGAYKWVMSGTGGVKDVVIFRVTKIQSVKGKVLDKTIYDTVRYEPKKELKETVLFINSNFLDMSQKAKWKYRLPSQFGGIDGEFHSFRSGAKEVQVSFKGKTGITTKIVCNVLVMPHQEAKKVHPKLSDLPDPKTFGSWTTWSGFVTIQEEREQKPEPAAR